MSSASSFRASATCDQWCDVLGFVPAGSVSSSSTIQIFLDASHMRWLLRLPVHQDGWCTTHLDQHDLLFQGGQCRVLAHSPSMAALVISQPSANHLFPGFGIKKVCCFVWLCIVCVCVCVCTCVLGALWCVVCLQLMSYVCACCLQLCVCACVLWCFACVVCVCAHVCECASCKCFHIVCVHVCVNACVCV